MKRIMILVLMILVLIGCSNEATNTASYDESQKKDLTYEKITAEEALALMVDGNMILDVRTKEEYDEGHIEGAVLLPHDQILEGQVDLLTDKDQVILVYCRSGNRSKQAAEKLVELGYGKVYDFGGIRDWPYDIVK